MSIRIDAKKLAKYDRRRCREKQRAKLEEARRKQPVLVASTGEVLPQWQAAFLQQHTKRFNDQDDPANSFSLITRDDWDKLASICFHAKERGEERGVLSLLQQHIRSDSNHVETWCPGWVRVKQRSWKLGFIGSQPAEKCRLIYYLYWGRVVVDPTGRCVVTVIPWKHKPQVIPQRPRSKDEPQGISRRPPRRRRIRVRPHPDHQSTMELPSEEVDEALRHDWDEAYEADDEDEDIVLECALPESEVEWGMAIWGDDSDNTATVALILDVTMEIAKERFHVKPSDFVTEPEGRVALLCDELSDIDAV